MYFAEVKKNFGFGCMRLPMLENGTDVDIAETTISRLLSWSR